MNLKNEFFNRRAALLANLQAKNSLQDQDTVIFFAGFEQSAKPFFQENNFYYFSGVTEPGSVLTFDLKNQVVVYAPNTGGLREKWVSESILGNRSMQQLGLESIKPLGSQIAGYAISPFIYKENYANLIDHFLSLVRSGGRIFLATKNKLEQTFLLGQLIDFCPEIKDRLVDISDLIAELRRVKSETEIGHLCQAIEITAMAQEAAARAIKPGVSESVVQAALEYVFTVSGASIAFPSIVGSGSNSTVLHYTENSALLKKGDLVVVDIGARYQYYCADITRTYPIGGKFNSRQLEIYQLVLDTQTYVAEHARPGMWINNKEFPDKSLFHLAADFMRKNGDYDQYFIHSIGHYLGLDVHDVGSYKLPLQVGDVITIEPGIYLSNEQIGVRIEDNYLITEHGNICLSEQIEKEANLVEKLASSEW